MRLSDGQARLLAYCRRAAANAPPSARGAFTLSREVAGIMAGGLGWMNGCELIWQLRAAGLLEVIERPTSFRPGRYRVTAAGMEQSGLPRMNADGRR